jgi:hypothetical protein
VPMRRGEGLVGVVDGALSDVPGRGSRELERQAARVLLHRLQRLHHHVQDLGGHRRGPAWPRRTTWAWLLEGIASPLQNS